MEGVEARTIERINNAQVNNVFVAADRKLDWSAIGQLAAKDAGEVEV